MGVGLAVGVLACSTDSGSSSSDEPAPSGGNTASGGGGTGGVGGAGLMGGGGSFSPSGSGGGVTVGADVEVIITADNAYGFGYGTETEMLNYFGGVEAITAGQIFNCAEGPETYVVPGTDAAAGNYLYIIGYADKAVTQGVLGQFRRVGGGEAVYTGQGNWSVCATGQDFNPGSGGPMLSDINTALPSCVWLDETGDATGKVQYGEDNTTPYDGGPQAGNEFPLTCDIDDAARWMWFNWDPQNIIWPTNGSPFLWPGGSGNDAGEFLIFRLGATDVPEPPS